MTGDVNLAALDDLVRLCVQLDKLRHNCGPGGGGDGPAAPGPPAPGPDTARGWEALEQAIIGKAMILLMYSGSVLNLQKPLRSVRTSA